MITDRNEFTVDTCQQISGRKNNEMLKKNNMLYFSRMVLNAYLLYRKVQ
jgi:hypothetical protein